MYYVKGQIVKTLGSVGHAVPVAITQLVCYSKEATNNT